MGDAYRIGASMLYRRSRGLHVADALAPVARVAAEIWEAPSIPRTGEAI